MIPRIAEETLEKLARGYPVVAITGPRQSGKTTLARKVFAGKRYVSLEDPDQRQFAMEDPKGFLAGLPDGAVLDEVQRCPELFSWLQGVVDRDGRMGLFILTGSQQFGLLSGITQSLAGRVGRLQLLPFSLAELAASGRVPATLDELLYWGAYPPLYDREVEPSHWYADYVATYLERDVRTIMNIRDLAVFQRFVRLCAGRNGQLLNLSSLANDCGISQPTARAWLSVLEASYIVLLLPPYHRNFRKRIVKTPKLYFLDTGLLCWLLGLQNVDQLAIHSQRGAIFESWVVQELLKGRYNRALASNLYFWRDRSGNEVDLLLEQGEKLQPVEVKAGQTVTRDQLAGLRRWLEISERENAALATPHLVYGGTDEAQRQGIQILPWHQIGQLVTANAPG